MTIPRYLNGHSRPDWVGRLVEFELQPEDQATRRGRIRGYVVGARAERCLEGMVCWLTIAEPDGFLYPGIEARRVVEVASDKS